MRKITASLAALAISTFAAPAQLYGEIIAETDLILDGSVVRSAGSIISPVGTTANGNWGFTYGFPGCNHGTGYKSYYELGKPGVPIGFGSYAYTSPFQCGTPFHSSGPHSVLFRFWSAETDRKSVV